MTSIRHGVVLLSCVTSTAWIARTSTAPAPVQLAWADVRVLLFPDSTDGTLIAMDQVYRGAPPTHLVRFGAFVDPDTAGAWIPAARAFLRRDIPASDTSRVAVSPPLAGADGEALFFARRKGDSGWTADRYLGLRNHPARAVQYINLSQRAAEEFLDSLGAVVLRTPVVDTRGRRRTLITAPDTLECPVPVPGNPAPRYPVDERNRNIEGHVWASLVITERGTVEANSVQVLFASREAFARAVRDAAPRFRFEPAQRDGVAIPKRVVMPFVFQLTRPGEAWPSASRNQPSERCS